MKKLVIIALLSLSMTGFAQEKKKQMNDGQPEFTAQQQNVLHLKKLTLELDLTAQQQKEISEIIANQQEKREATKAEMKKNRAEKKKLTNEEKFVLKNRVLDEKIALKNQMKKVLTANQLEKWEKMHKHGKRNQMMQKKQQSKRKMQIEK